MIGVVGAIARCWKSWRYIYAVQDLYPETARALDVLGNGPFYRLCRRANIALLRGADAVVAINRAMADHIGFMLGNQDNVQVIPNWADGQKIGPPTTRPVPSPWSTPAIWAWPKRSTP